MGRNTLNSYAAGLLDGEGCVRWNGGPSVEVTNKHGGVLQQMRAKWSGSIRIKGDCVFVWTLYGRKAIQFLEDVARYSIIKHPQIVELFAACATTDPVKRSLHINTLKRLKHVYAD